MTKRKSIYGFLLALCFVVPFLFLVVGCDDSNKVTNISAVVNSTTYNMGEENNITFTYGETVTFNVTKVTLTYHDDTTKEIHEGTTNQDYKIIDTDNILTQTMPNAGSHRITIKYGSKELLFNIVINQATNSWITEPTVADKVYDGEEIAPTFEAKYGDVIVLYSVQNPQTEQYTVYPPNTAPVSAGTYKVTFRVDVTANWSALETVTRTFVISPLEAELNWEGEDEILAYDGNAKILTATVSNLIEGDECDVTASLTDGYDNINCGTFTFTATALSNSNYKLPENCESDEFTIANAFRQFQFMNYQQGEFEGFDDGVAVSIISDYEPYNTSYYISSDDITNFDGFSLDYNFGTTTEKTFNISYTHNEKTYTLPFTYTKNSSIEYFYVNYICALNDDLKIYSKETDSYSSTEVPLSNFQIVAGTFDNSQLGDYNFILKYNNFYIKAEVEVYDPDDTTISYMSINHQTVCWIISNEIITENFTGLYLQVDRNNKTTEYIEVTHDMISYSYDEGNSFEVTVTFEGESTTFDVYLFSEDYINNSDNIYDMYLYSDQTYSPSFNIEDKDISPYYLEVVIALTEDAEGFSDYGVYNTPLTSDMLFTLNEDGEAPTYEAFSLETASSGAYPLEIKFADEYLSKTAYIYTTEDLETTFAVSDNNVLLISLNTGMTSDEMKAEITQYNFFYQRSFNYDSYYSKIIDYEQDITLTASMIDLSTLNLSEYGMQQVTINYSATVTGLLTVVILPPSTPTEYIWDGEQTIYVYNEGVVLTGGGLVYEYTVYDPANNIISVEVTLFDTTYSMLLLVDSTEHTLTTFTASLLGGEPVNYYIVEGEETITLAVYTKNSMSYVDVIDSEDPTSVITQPVTIVGNQLTFMGAIYDIGEGNYLTIAILGTTVYTYTMPTDPNYPGVTETVLFNDNGVAYCCVDGVAVLSGEWTEEENVITITISGIEYMTFTVDEEGILTSNN